MGQLCGRRQAPNAAVESARPGYALSPGSPGHPTLRQVVVVHRHGARFPTKPIGPRDPSWPQNEAFWKAYKGQLSPVGSKMITDLGEEFRACYVEGPCKLFEGVETVDGNTARSYTSNVQRTLQSAWAFMHGMWGSTASVFFAFRTDRVVNEDIRHRTGVPIFIQDTTKNDDKLFHSWNSDPEVYKKWFKSNLKRSALFTDAAKDPEYQQMIDKVYKVTGNAKLGPAEDGKDNWMDRMKSAKNVSTACEVQAAHSQPILPSSMEGVSLTERDIELLQNLAKEHQRIWFQDAVIPPTREQSFGGSDRSHSGAALLAHTIWQLMDRRAKGETGLRLLEFSGHDTSVAALCAHLGVEVPGYGFACHWVFELHEGPQAATDTKRKESGTDVQNSVVENPMIYAYFNPFPFGARLTPAIRLAQLKARRLPSLSDTTMRRWEEQPEGGTSLEDLASVCRLATFDEACSAIGKLLAMPAASGRQALQDAIDKCRHLDSTRKVGGVTACLEGHDCAAFPWDHSQTSGECDLCTAELDHVEIWGCKTCSFWVCDKCRKGNQGAVGADKFKQLFDSVDVDRSGFVDAKEVAAMLAENGQYSTRNPKLVQIMFELLGKKEGESMQFEEFGMMMEAIAILEHGNGAGGDRASDDSEWGKQVTSGPDADWNVCQSEKPPPSPAKQEPAEAPTEPPADDPPAEPAVRISVSDEQQATPGRVFAGV